MSNSIQTAATDLCNRAREAAASARPGIGNANDEKAALALMSKIRPINAMRRKDPAAAIAASEEIVSDLATLPRGLAEQVAARLANVFSSLT